MKTVIQVVQHLRPGGIETLVLDLLLFSPKDEKTIILSLEGDMESAIQNWPKLSIYRENLCFVDKKPGISLALLSTLIKIFNKHSVTAVHTHHIGPLLYSGLAARLCGIKHLTHTEHDAWHLNNKKRCLLQRVAIKMLKPTLVADAQTVADNMRQKLKCKNPITVIRNGINSQQFIPGDQRTARKLLNLPKNVPMIGCSGRMETVKGQHVLIHALNILPITIHIAFAGSGSKESELRALSDKLGLTERVHFIGHTDQMPTFYQALDVFCLPSLNEGFPLSPLEAQACNIQTLVTDVGASKETLCPHSGQHVPANDPQKMAKALFDMLKNPTIEKPRDFVTQQGDVKTMAIAYANLRNKGVIEGACYE